MKLFLCLLAINLVLRASVNGLLMCPNDRMACSSEAEAMCNGKGKCSCKPGMIGDPHLACQDKMYDICEIKSDPEGHTFGAEPHKGIDITIPCQFLVAHYQSKSSKHNVECDVKVFASERRYEGKLYVYGFMVEIDYNIPVNGKSGYIDLRAQGFGYEDSYTYILERKGTKGFWRNDPEDYINLNTVPAMFRGDNYFVENPAAQRVDLKVEKCGLKLQFRPADVAKKVLEQNKMPGITVAVDSTTHDITYDSLDTAFCLTSVLEDENVASIVENSHLNNDETFLLRGLISDNTHDFPGLAKMACTLAGDTLRACKDNDPQRLKLAMESCSFILEEPLFMRCYGDREDSRELIHLFGNCTAGYCNYDHASCARAQTNINMKGCGVSDRKANLGFIGFNCGVLNI